MEHMRDVDFFDVRGELSVRAFNSLRHEGCLTLEDVAKLDDKFIKHRMINIGKVTANEIIEYKKLMSSLCYLRVEDRSPQEISVFDNMGGEIIVSDYEQIAQLCVDLLTLRDTKWGSVNDDVEPDDLDDDEDGAIDIMVDPEDCFLKIEQDGNVISFANKEQAQSIAEALLMLVQEKGDEE